MKKTSYIIFLLLVVFVSVLSLISTIINKEISLDVKLVQLSASLSSLTFGIVKMFENIQFLRKGVFKITSKFRVFSMRYKYIIISDQFSEIGLTKLSNHFKENGFDIIKNICKKPTHYIFEIRASDKIESTKIEIEYLNDRYDIKFYQVAGTLRRLIKHEITEINRLVTMIRGVIQLDSTIQKELFQAQFIYNGKNPYTKFLIETPDVENYIINIKSENNFRLTNDVVELSAINLIEMNDLIESKLLNIDY